AARGGAGLVMTEMIAVSTEGRVTPGSPGLYRDDQRDAWARLVERLHRETSARVGLQLGHAGRRGATRPRHEGLDRPLRDDAWPLLSASAIPYTPRSQVPRSLEAADMDRVCEAFVRAARRAAAAGVDLLQLDFGH